ncbi:MAG: lipid II flippase MurJ, partial [Pseudomonadota bacterium]
TLAGLAEPGALTAFAYALKLFLLPVMMLFAPLATVLLPRFTDTPDDRLLMESAIAMMLVLSLATLAAGLSSGDAIARLIYFRGAMTEEGMMAVTAMARWMFIAIPFAALELIGAAALNARRQTGRVMLHAMIAFALSSGLALLRPDLVMPAFVLFYVCLAALHLAALKLDAMARRMRIEVSRWNTATA